MMMVVLVFDTSPPPDVAAVVDALQARFGPVVATRLEFTPPIGGVPAPPVTHNFAPRTNQEVLNLLRSIFGSGYWEVIERAGLVWLAASRGAVYSGEDVEALPIHAEEKKRIVAAH